MYSNIFAFSSWWFAMLGEPPSSVIDTYTFIIHFHVHSLFHYVSARPAGITQLKTGVHPYMMIVKYDHMRIVK